MARGRRRRHEEGEFPGFTDVAEIGAGGFSTVYRAVEVATNRPVALKLLQVGPEVTAHALESFRRETLALGALSSHPHIVTLYRSFTTASGRPVLVLELCRGSMAARLSAGPVPAEEAVSVAVRLAGALETAHRVGMLHRDVKPQNVLLTAFGEPALADFGVARLQASAEQATGAFGFTTLHAPPELLEGAPASPATDVYELASTLYQLLSGRPAFHAFEGEAPAAAALRILRDPVPPLAVRGVPVALSDLLLAAMDKAPEGRPQSAGAFAAHLQAIAGSAGWAPTRAVVPEDAPPADGVGTGGSPGMPSAPPPPRAPGGGARSEPATVPPPARSAPPAAGPPSAVRPAAAAPEAVATSAETTLGRHGPVDGIARRPPSLVTPAAGRRQVLDPVPGARPAPRAARVAAPPAGRAVAWSVPPADEAPPPPSPPPPAPPVREPGAPAFGYEPGRPAATGTLEDTVLRPAARCPEPPEGGIEEPPVPPRRRWRRRAPTG